MKHFIYGVLLGLALAATGKLLWDRHNPNPLTPEELAIISTQGFHTETIVKRIEVPVDSPQIGEVVEVVEADLDFGAPTTIEPRPLPDLPSDCLTVWSSVDPALIQLGGQCRVEILESKDGSRHARVWQTVAAKGPGFEVTRGPTLAKEVTFERVVETRVDKTPRSLITSLGINSDLEVALIVHWFKPQKRFGWYGRLAYDLDPGDTQEVVFFNNEPELISKTLSEWEVEGGGSVRW